MNKSLFDCPTCGKGFRSEEALRMHADSKHNGLPESKPEENCADCEVPSYPHREKPLRSLAKDVLDVFFSARKKQSVEREMLKLAVWTFIGLLVLGAIGYWGFFSSSPQFMERHGIHVFYLMIGLVAISATMWHLKAYQNVSCQTGMMVGMTVGMLTGFLVGMIVGISNGMFVGSVAGLLLGVLVGSWAGKCCGIMGVLEGQMAGFMAGPMGAMTTIMMVSDNYVWFIPIALLFSVMILAGLMFLLYEENSGKQLNIAKKTAKQDFFLFLVVNFVVLLALAWLMIYGPKSALFQVSLN